MDNIMIVEDEGISALFLKKMLEKMGHSVSKVVAKGEDAIEFAKDNDFSLILMDIKLKGDMDGIEAAEGIKHFSKVPVVYITGNSDSATRERAMGTGPHGFLEKPVDVRALRKVLNDIFPV